MNYKIIDILHNYFPIFVEEHLIQEIQESAKLISLPADSILMNIGTYIKQMPLLVSGVIKITREDKEGNELLLYYLNSGETCTMSMMCCMGDTRSKVRATVIEDAEIIMLPVRKLNQWIREYDSIRNFVFQTYQNRFEEMLYIIDSIAFLKMDQRLERYLFERCKELDTNMLSMTHQEIAQDMNTSREVISRLLKQMERLGKIKLHRFKIEVTRGVGH